MSRIKKKNISLAVISENLFTRKLLVNLLHQEPNITVQIECDNIVDFQKKICDVEIVILYESQIGLNVIDSLHVLRTNCYTLKPIVISEKHDLSKLMELLHIGIYAFITSKNQISNLFDAIDVVSKGAIYRTSIMTEALYMNKEASVKVKDTRINIILNDREKKIIELLWKGKNDKEISSLIYRSVSSVEKLKYELKEKIGVKSIPELFNYALKAGIISLI